jgi:hypothetical protein
MTSSYSMEVSGTLRALDKKIKTGLPFHFELKLAPSSLISKNDLASLKQSKLIPNLYISELVVPSERDIDSDFYFFEGVGILKGKFNSQDEIYFEANNISYRIALENLSTISDEGVLPVNQVSLNLIKKEIRSEGKYSSYIKIFLILVIVLMFSLRKKMLFIYSEKQRIKKQKIKAVEILNFLKSVELREDLEKVYVLRNEIKSVYAEYEVNFDELYSKINLHQFKKDWPIAELNNTLTSLKGVVSQIEARLS